MTTNKTRVTYSGMNKDLSKSKFSNNLYFDANNIKLTPVEGQTYGAVSNAYGNKLVLTLPSPVIFHSEKRIEAGDQVLPYSNTEEIDTMPTISGTQIIIGDVNTKDGFLLFTTDNNGFDCIWEIKSVEDDPLIYKLLYIRDMGFSSNRLIDAIFNYENVKIQKTFWIDGTNYLRYINISQSIANGYDKELIDLPVASINSKSTFNVSQPEVKSAGGGGTHTAGVIQYGYTLYNLQGSETSLSPLSNPFPLGKGDSLGGGKLNEVVGAMPVIQINSIDRKFNFIKLYSVKYTTYNGTPSITLIYDGGIGNYNNFTYNDTGATNLGQLSTAQFLFLGADAIKPTHIATKDNTLFVANNKTTAYKLNLDTRAYSFNAAGNSAPIYNNVTYTGLGDIPYTGDLIDASNGFNNIPDTFDAVNLDFDTYRYQRDSIIVPGGTILKDASYVKAIASTEGAVVFVPTNYTLTKSVTAECNSNNIVTKYTYIDVTPPPSGITDIDKLTVKDNGIYNFTLQLSENLPDIPNEVSPSSISMEAVVTSISGNETIYTFEKDNLLYTSSSFQTNFYKLTVNLAALDSVKFRIKYGYHYNNNYCDWKSIDPVTGSVFVDDSDIYLTPLSTKTTIKEFEILSFTGKKGIIITDTNIPITPVNGESIISNGKVNFNYSGGAKVDIVSDVVVTTTIPTDQTLFSIGIFKNNARVASIPLNLNRLGVISQSKTIQLNVLPGDVLSTVLMYKEPGEPFKAGVWDLSFAGRVSIYKTTSASTSVEGGVGKYITYELSASEASEVNTKSDRFFKDNEIYRIAILLRNTLGQESEAKWIADFKAPAGNLHKQYNTLKVGLTPAFYDYIDTLPDEDKPVSYTILRAIRGSQDKTIVTQGLMTGMMVQARSLTTEDYDTIDQREAANKGLVKLPTLMTRGFNTGPVTSSNSYYPVMPTLHNESMNGRDRHDFIEWREKSRTNNGIRAEIYSDEDYTDTKGTKIQRAWQYTKLMQLHSPEAAFQLPVNTTSSDELVVLGYMLRDKFEFIEQETNQDTLVIKTPTHNTFNDGEIGGFLPYLPGGFGVVGPSYVKWTKKGVTTDENNTKESRQLHTHKTFSPLIRSEKTYKVYGSPEVTEVGQAPKYYNKDFSLRYANRLSSIITDDKGRHRNGQKLDNVEGIVGVDTEGDRCITLALGDNNTKTIDRVGLEELWANTGANALDWDSEVFAELRKSKEFIYSGALYGGYDTYSRANTEYISTGGTFNIAEDIVYITSPGDTFVQTYKNTRLSKAPGSVYSKTRQIVCETLEYLVETIVNLEERDDISVGPWGRSVDPLSEEANSYNTVYSTNTSLLTYKTDNLKVNLIKQLDTQVIASKIKIPGEFVESWTDFLPNEVQHLDGKYGPINALVNHFDELYTFQDTGVARLSINPRVQVKGSDSIGLELGTGSKLHDYNYISTTLGSVNKWGIVSANSGLYFLDATSKQLFRVSKGVEGVSTSKGMVSFYKTNLDKNKLEVNNPILEQGVVAGVDGTNGDIYLTVMNSATDKHTLSFNETMNVFTSFYSFTPSRYITKGDKMFTVSPNNNEIWLHYAGAYQTYYGTKYDSDITLLINGDNPSTEKVFNNIEFDSEVTLDGIDVPGITLNTIKAWNDYQTSIEVPLGAKRKIRTWRASLPREEASRNRLRDKWIFMKLGFNYAENYKLVLHDMVVGFTQIK